MRGMIDNTRLGALMLLTLGLVAGCGGSGSRAEQPTADEPVLVSPGSIVIVDSATLHSGPTISGSLQPEHVAAIRAEIGGSVLATRAEAGQRVAKGDTLARIDDSAIRDSWLSARSGVTTADQSAQVAHRNLERTQRLADAGAVSERDLETARINASAADAQLDDARARLAQAGKQLASTRITSPINGIVSERAVNAGDIVSPGMLLYSVVDPGSMRLEAAVPASQLGDVRVGAPVEFSVTGYPERSFTGRIARVNPVVDPATGQIAIMATLPNQSGQLVGGVFAQGRVGAQTRRALAAPANAVIVNGDAATVLRIRGGVVERINVGLGLHDEQAERWAIISGLERGDSLLMGAAQGYTPGTRVHVQAPVELSTSH